VRDRDLVLSTVANITKTIVGAGVLALPLAVQEGGVGLGLGCLCATGAVSLCGFLAIGYSCSATGARTYREAWERTVGWRPEVVDLMLFWETIICCIGYMILMLDYMSVGLREGFGFEPGAELRNQLAVLVTGVFLIPLCLQPTFRSLRHTSMFGNAAIGFTIGFVILESAMDGLPEAGAFAGVLGESRRGVLQATSVMTSAYISHYSAPVLLSELRQHSSPWRGFCLASAASFGLVVLLYAAFAIAGFARFAPEVKGNVLLNYGNTPCTMISWICMAFTMIVTFPLQFKIARDAVTPAMGFSLPAEGVSPCWGWKRMVVLMVGTTAAVGAVLSDISEVLAFRGALLGCPISFTLPGLMLLSLPAEARRTDDRASCRRVVAKVLIAFGVCSSLLGLSVCFGVAD